VTISRSVGSGFTPLRYHFLADYLAALFEVRAADCGHFERLIDIASLCRGNTLDDAVSACRSELELYPDCPATWHLLSLAANLPEEAVTYRDWSAELCPAYEVSVLREACEFPARGLPLDLATVRALENRFVAGQRSAAEDALTWAALGLLHCHLGRVESARECYRQTTRHFPSHAVLASALANVLIRARRPKEAIPFLELATINDKTAAGAHMLLGSALTNAGDLANADVHLQAASALAPAWTELMELRGKVLAAAGQAQAAASLRQQSSSRRQQALRAVERLRAH
jgi:predicted Zn-dependent protease